MKLLKQNISFKKVVVAVILAFGLTYIIQIFITANVLTDINAKVENIVEQQENFTKNYAEELYEDHLSLQEKLALQGKVNLLEQDINELINKNENENYIKIQSISTQYEDFKKNLDRNQGLSISEDLAFDPDQWGKLLLEENYDALEQEISEANVSLESDYKEYLASLPPPPSQPGKVMLTPLYLLQKAPLTLA